MDLSNPGFVYLFLIIPTFFALAILAQGLGKVSQGQQEGYVGTLFGIVFLLLIAAAYVFFIRT